MVDNGDEISLEKVAKRRKRKPKSHVKIVESESEVMKHKTTDGQKRAYKKRKHADEHEIAEGKSRKSKKRKKRTRHRHNVDVDEVARLERRTRYLLVRLRLEQNLIDAYLGEGWKGQSREKIKPDKELQRAKKQILKCKLGIREAIRQLDLLSSEGCMEKSFVAQDGSIHHEHIICAKCKLQEAFPDNDIILCDGTCNCAYHQKCLDPPLLTENIPPGDQGWFCKFCVCRMKIIEITNSHLGTHFSDDTHWQDIFKEEAALPEGEVALDEQEWPSDDSEDENYDPDKIEINDNVTRVDPGSDGSDDATSSSSLWSLEDEVLSESETLLAPLNKDRLSPYIDTNVGVDTDDTTDCEVLSGPRQRRAVDYRKLYDEMFGKDAPVVELNSEDEDWGPVKRKRKQKDSNAAEQNSKDEDLGLVKRKRKQKESNPATTLVNLSVEPDSIQMQSNACIDAEHRENDGAKKQNFRIPHDAVEKLRLAFAENELPSRATRVNISEELGIDYEKINKWFKNARYMALKARKTDKGDGNQSASQQNESDSKIEPQKKSDQMASDDFSSALIIDLSKHSVKECGKNKSQPLASSQKKKPSKRAPLKCNKVREEIDDDASLKEFANKRKSSTPKAKSVKRQDREEAELERLFKIKDRVEKLQNVLQRYRKPKSRKKNAALMDEHDSMMYVPIAQLVEKQ